MKTGFQEQTTVRKTKEMKVQGPKRHAHYFLGIEAETGNSGITKKIPQLEPIG